MQLMHPWGVQSWAPCLHHVPRTGKGSSKELLSSAHLPEDTDDSLLLLLHSKYNHQAKDLQELS